MKKILFLTVLSCFFNCLAQKTTKPSTKTFSLGQIEEISSNILNEKRTLNIYLPDGYDAKNPNKYAVIYVLDGSATEDFIHITGLVQYFTFP